GLRLLRLPRRLELRHRRGADPARRRDPRGVTAACAPALLERRTGAAAASPAPRPSSRIIDEVIAWRTRSMPRQGSRRWRARRAGSVVTVRPAGSTPAASSSQVIGAATTAPSRARVEYGAMALAPSALRREWPDIRPA